MTVLPGLIDQPSGLVSEFREQLFAIADWWIDNVFDLERGDFAGEVDEQNNVDKRADRSDIYSSRILWFFSELAGIDDSPNYRRAAEIAYHKLIECFWDEEFGGFYWSVDFNGRVVDDKKHVYAQSFSIYALCAYYSLTGLEDALLKALAVFQRLESDAYQEDFGYYETFTRDWQRIEDTRLSEDEPQCARNINTQLHLLEAYTALYMLKSEPGIFDALKSLVECFLQACIDKDSGHLKMYANTDWSDCSTFYSYGHDIECSWLIWEAVEILNDSELLSACKPVVISMAESILAEAVGEHGGIVDGYDRVENKPITKRMWWVQAEAMVGLLNAYQLSGNLEFYRAFEKVWYFIKTQQVDQKNGEWFWHSLLDQNDSSQVHYKAGFWKAPYHNGRAMMQVCNRLASITRGV